jgi:hypothetical protein
MTIRRFNGLMGRTDVTHNDLSKKAAFLRDPAVTSTGEKTLA